MAIGPGTQFGVYAVGEMLGKGGMGEVYKARDTKLDRIVAIKVLPASVANDRELLARFEREAKTLASLNHSNIAHIYGLEDFGGVMALVMEYVPGPTLRERLNKGPVPVKEALGIARQIASALEAAHENGIIHRDLKPANVKLTAEGAVKLLDFGLAKSVAPSKAPTDETETMALQDTGTGVILGTAGYMAPEQVLGAMVDRRADVWAYGAVVYELLSGKRAFAGSTLAEVMAATLRAEVDWNALPRDTPGQVITILQRCLERDRNARIRDIGDAWRLVEDRPVARPSSRRWLWPAVAGALAAGLAVSIWLGRSTGSSPQFRRLTVSLGDDVDLGVGMANAIAISRDGTRIAYSSFGADRIRRLVTRRLSDAEPRVLAGTDQAANPFFSPDGEWIGFFSGGKLKKISSAGGSIVVLCDVAGLAAMSGSWGDDGNIIASFGSRLMRVPGSGGTPEPVTTLAQAETHHRWPVVLPGSKAALFFSNVEPYANSGSVEAIVFATGERKMIQHGGYDGRYLSSGHLLWFNSGTAYVAPFDPVKLKITGPTRPVIERVAVNDVLGSAQFAVSDEGTVIYVEQKGSPQSTLQWLEPDGKLQPILAKPGEYSFPVLSPDGKQLAYLQQVANNRDIWVHDLARDVSRRLTLTPDGNEYVFVWTPDSKSIIYSLGKQMRIVRADGSSEPETIFEHANSSVFIHAMSADGRFLAYCIQGVKTGNDLWTLPLEWTGGAVKAGEPKVFQATQFVEIHAGFTPDSKWLAFTSDESGVSEVYARSFPSAAGKVQISSNGGAQPYFAPGGRELFYVGGDGQPMIVSYEQSGDSIRFSKPRVWAQRRLGVNTSLRRFAVAPGGKRMVVSVPDETQLRRNFNEIVFLENFTSELRRSTAK